MVVGSSKFINTFFFFFFLKCVWVFCHQGCKYMCGPDTLEVRPEKGTDSLELKTCWVCTQRVRSSFQHSPEHSVSGTSDFSQLYTNVFLPGRWNCAANSLGEAPGHSTFTNLSPLLCVLRLICRISTHRKLKL